MDKLAYFGDVLDDMGKIAPSSSFAEVPLPFKQVAISDYISRSNTPTLVGERSSSNVVAFFIWRARSSMAGAT